MSNPFDELPDPPTGAGDALALARLEERVCRQLLAYYELAHQATLLRRRAAQAGGPGQLRFSYFLAEHPDFPVYLTFARVPYLLELTMADWLMRFTTTPAFQEFARQQELVPEPYFSEGQPVALVFPLYNMGTGLAVLSNGPRPLGDEHCRIARVVRGVHYAFEPFRDFLAGLAWSPA